MRRGKPPPLPPSKLCPGAVPGHFVYKTKTLLNYFDISFTLRTQWKIKFCFQHAKALIKPMCFRWFLCTTTIKTLFVVVDSYASHIKTNAFSLIPMLLIITSYNNSFFVYSYRLNAKNIINPLFFSLVPMLFTTKPMLSRWFLCFSYSIQCFFFGSYAFDSKANAFSLVPMFLFNKAIVFLLVPVLCTVEPMLFRWLLCFSL